MANIVALKDMADVPGVLITIDSSKECAIAVEYQWNIYKFKEFQDVLYYYDTAVDKFISGATDKSNSPINPYSFISTVEYKKSYFSRNKIEGANNARKLQHIIEWYSTDNFKPIIKNNSLTIAT